MSRLFGYAIPAVALLLTQFVKDLSEVKSPQLLNNNLDAADRNWIRRF